MDAALEGLGTLHFGESSNEEGMVRFQSPSNLNIAPLPVSHARSSFEFRAMLLKI